MSEQNYQPERPAAVHLKEACKVTGTYWATWLQMFEGRWVVLVQANLNKAKQSALMEFIQELGTASWLAGTLTSGRSRTRQTGSLASTLKCHHREGMAILEQEQVDLLLVDIRLPGGDGFQIVDLARHHQPDMAVVMMTGYATVETAIEALQRGADGLILKPFAGAELVQSVKRALQESRHKQSVLRLQTLRPLFTITESLFTETNPERLQDLFVDTVLGHLRCSQAAIALENASLQKVEESQRALVKAEKLAIAGWLNASIAHEINNPLQAVQIADGN